MILRPALPDDAPAISAMLKLLVAAGKRKSPADEAFILAHYIDSPEGICCTVAEGEDGRILGLQALKRAVAGNPYDTPVGWGIIGTHVSPVAARSGIGSRLFEVTKDAADAAGLADIEAFIGAGNAEGQAYYEKMGFRTWRLAEGAVCKRFQIGDGTES